MPQTDIENFDGGQIPDPTDELNFHANAAYVIAHLANVIIPGINANLQWINAALAGDTQTLLDSLAAHQSDANNPHGVTAAQIGAPTVSDMTAALAAKLDTSAAALFAPANHTHGDHLRYSVSGGHPTLDLVDWLRLQSDDRGLLPFSNGGSHIGTSGWRFAQGWFNAINGGVPWTSTNHGPGSGLNADLLDGYQASAFALAGHGHTGMLKGADIGSGVNLNGMTTTGVYHQNSNSNAASGSNYPTALAGWLEVFSDGSMTYQRYTIYSTGEIYTRSHYSGTWHPWRRVLDSISNPDSPQLVAAAYATLSGATLTLQHAHNVSSITRQGVGNYTVNFSSALPNANYYALVNADDSGAYAGNMAAATGLARDKTASNFKIRTSYNYAPSPYEADFITVLVWR